MEATLNPKVLPAVSVKPATLEDPLAYLPWSVISEYGKDEAIYTYGQPSAGIYLVVKGKVKILR
jgi:CRP/FNR family cyclic AMP-dependent transcriptional regulator